MCPSFAPSEVENVRLAQKALGNVDIVVYMDRRPKALAGQRTLDTSDVRLKLPLSLQGVVMVDYNNREYVPDSMVDDGLTPEQRSMVLNDIRYYDNIGCKFSVKTVYRDAK